MPYLWYKLAKDGELYDYLSHHIDNFLMTSDDFSEFIEILRKEYVATRGELLHVHLGMNIQQDEESAITLSSQDYISQVVEMIK